MKLSYIQRKKLYAYLFLLPFMSVFLIFVVYPNLYTLYLSFTSAPNSFSAPQFSGLSNFVALWFEDTKFWLSIYNTAQLWIMGFIPQLGVALYLGYVFSYAKLRGVAFFRLIFFFPNLVAAAVMGRLLFTLFSADGVINDILLNVNLFSSPFEFFRNVFASRSIVAFANWLMWFGYTTIIISAGLTGISPEYIEAAKIDGAKSFQIFRFIVMPLLKPTLLYIFITSLVGGIQMFDIPYIVGNEVGEPNSSLLTMVNYLQIHAFEYGDYGYGASIAWSIFLITFFISLFAWRFNAPQKKESKK